MAVRLVNSTTRRAIIRMSTIGSVTRSSMNPHSRNSATEPPNRPTIGDEPQPSCWPSVSPTSRQIRAAESVTAPFRSTLEGDVIRESGTKRHTRKRATATTTALTTNR